jgi:TonB family protein
VKEVTMKRLIILSLVLLAGCAPARLVSTAPTAPELISVSSLPYFTSGSLYSPIQIEVIFEVRRDGAIAGIRMIHSSGDPDWDRVALETMARWHFAEIASLNDSSTMAVRTRVNVRPEEQLSLPLGSLVAGSFAEAESLCTMLRAGASFDSLASTPRWDSPGKRGSYLGLTDVGTFPYHIRQELRCLRCGNVTPPLRLGSEYVIFKRFTMPL